MAQILSAKKRPCISEEENFPALLSKRKKIINLPQMSFPWQSNSETDGVNQEEEAHFTSEDSMPARFVSISIWRQTPPQPQFCLAVHISRKSCSHLEGKTKWDSRCSLKAKEGTRLRAHREPIPNLICFVCNCFLMTMSLFSPSRLRDWGCHWAFLSPE